MYTRKEGKEKIVSSVQHQQGKCLSCSTVNPNLRKLSRRKKAQTIVHGLHCSQHRQQVLAATDIPEMIAVLQLSGR